MEALRIPAAWWVITAPQSLIAIIQAASAGQVVPAAWWVITAPQSLIVIIQEALEAHALSAV
jgi:hypothetical protein